MTDTRTAQLTAIVNTRNLEAVMPSRAAAFDMASMIADVCAQLCSVCGNDKQDCTCAPAPAADTVTHQPLTAARIGEALTDSLKGPKLGFAQTVRNMNAQLGIASKEAYVSVPLWELFGWERVDFTAGALPDWGELMKAEDGAESYDAQFDAAIEPFINEFGSPIGKGDVAIRQVAGSQAFDLGEAHWRLIDFVRAPTTRPHDPYTLDLTPEILLTKGDKALGDGVFARVRPETIGYTRALGLHEDTYLQVRAFYFAPDGVCRKVFKGLVHVTRDTAQEFFAPEAGYGPHAMALGDRVVIHPMLDVLDYTPQGRISDQLGKYAGVEDWYTRYAPGMTLRLNEHFEGSRMISAGCPIGFLPVDEAMRVAHEAFGKLTAIDMGVRRKAAPGLDLKPFTFRAPWEMSGLFQIGARYCVHRDPALPDGTSSWSGVCVGYTRGNYFHLPTAASPRCKQYLAGGQPLMVENDKGELVHAAHEYGVWEQGGGDFDGDDVLVMPHHTQGGIILGFNDRPKDEQDALRLAAGRAGRTKKLNYPTGTERWKRQRQKAVELGMLDFRARKLLDSSKSGRLLAAAVKPYIQAAVDGQKRITEYPMPLSKLPRMSGEYGTQVLSALKKTKADIQEDKTNWRHNWDLLEAKAAECQKIVDAQETGLLISEGQLAALQPVAEWALGVWAALKRQLMGTSAKHAGKNGAYPRANFFPRNQVTAYLQERRQAMLDKGWALADASGLLALEAQIVRARESRPGAARAAENLVSQLIREADDFDAIELSAQLTDAQLWMKAAPMTELLALFGRPEFSFPGVGSLPGVVIAGRGNQFKLLGRRAVSTRRLALGGCVYGPGELVIEEQLLAEQVRTDGRLRRTTQRHQLVLSGQGVVMAVAPGSFSNFQEAARALLASSPRKACVTLVDQLGGLGLLPVALLGDAERELYSEAFTPAPWEAEYADAEPVWDDCPLI